MGYDAEAGTQTGSLVAGDAEIAALQFDGPSADPGKPGNSGETKLGIDNEDDAARILKGVTDPDKRERVTYILQEDLRNKAEAAAAAKAEAVARAKRIGGSALYPIILPPYAISSKNS